MRQKGNIMNQIKNTYIKTEDLKTILDNEKVSLPDDDVAKITIAVIKWMQDIIENLPKYELIEDDIIQIKE